LAGIVNVFGSKKMSFETTVNSAPAGGVAQAAGYALGLAVSAAGLAAGLAVGQSAGLAGVPSWAKPIELPMTANASTTTLVAGSRNLRTSALVSFVRCIEIPLPCFESRDPRSRAPVHAPITDPLLPAPRGAGG